MSHARLLAVGFIYLCTALAWSVLGGTVVSRTGALDGRLAQEVAQLWGGRHEQVAPAVVLERPRVVKEQIQEKSADGRTLSRTVTRTVLDEIPLTPISSDVDIELSLDHRRKGLLWYDTYTVSFTGRYRFVSPDAQERHAVVRFGFPSDEAIYDRLVFRVNGRESGAVTDLSDGLVLKLHLGPSGEVELEVAYRSRGLGPWSYAFATEGVAQVRDFELTLVTDFDGLDFPPGTISPTTKAREGAGWRLRWAFESLIAGKRIGVDPPDLLNPGPLVARITFFAPVALLFFFVVMFVLGVLEGRSLHPMNYFFLAAAFFAFHLLLAYLVDHMEVNRAFAVAAATSVFLVVSYLRLVTGMRAALVEAGLAQAVFLVLFSYAFFFEGYTGLTVTVGAVLTLFVLMQITARVDWGRVFAGGDARPNDR